MGNVAIHVEGLGKKYQLGAKQARYKTLRESLIETLASPFRRVGHFVHGRNNGAADMHEKIWALKDVSFEVKHGEVIGIIGRNGAGKSTLLKILSRITEPTEGSARLYGRVGSLLEVGTGFHPELTGRENIFLNGAILGMRRREIEHKFDEIVAFAEIEKFIDTPVKHYSSGMYVRLAFAVAAHLEPEILMVDEVLAVGDVNFQKKCLGKMGDVAKSGRTILFVSHNMTAVQSLCERVIWLNNGDMHENGDTGRVISKYLQASFSSLTERVWDNIDAAPGNEDFRLHRVSVRPVNGCPADAITIRTPFVIEFEYWNLQQNRCIDLSLHLINEFGVTVFNSGTIYEEKWHSQPLPRGLFRTRCYIPGDFLNDGAHLVTLMIVKNQSTMLHHFEDLLAFSVEDSNHWREAWHGKWPGATRPKLAWDTERLAE